MQDCLFCKFVSNEIETDKVFENENVIAFKDINPVAAIHILFIHKKHSENIIEICNNDLRQVTDIFEAIGQWTQKNKLDQGGFRIINNMGEDGGQTVFHTHFHVIGGQKLNPGLN